MKIALGNNTTYPEKYRPACLALRALLTEGDAKRLALEWT